MPLCVSIFFSSVPFIEQCSTSEGKAQADEAKGPDWQPQHRGTLLLCAIRPHAEALSVAVTVVGKVHATVRGQYMQSDCALLTVQRRTA